MWLATGLLMILWGLRLLDKYPFLIIFPVLFEFYPYIVFYLLSSSYENFPTGISYQVCKTYINNTCALYETRFFMNRNDVLYPQEAFQYLSIGEAKVLIFLAGVSIATLRYITEATNKI